MRMKMGKTQSPVRNDAPQILSKTAPCCLTSITSSSLASPGGIFNPLAQEGYGGTLSPIWRPNIRDNRVGPRRRCRGSDHPPPLTCLFRSQRVGSAKKILERDPLCKRPGSGVCDLQGMMLQGAKEGACHRSIPGEQGGSTL
ncbi:hypothetical protein AAFF_G00047410 [Aldrovandia affinis]|uniref:Uncharacterized protein n=1 Tax=Aldrovandia affinis TaxID=143900 RepID=A0AAD7WFS1_9TELE|nr:hypothetical protein AAFF_G00047410 [Aldrovandia affinis]